MKSKSEFDESNIFNDIDNDARNVTEDDVKNLLKNEKVLIRKTEGINKSINLKLFYQIKLAFELIKDFTKKKYTDVPWRTVGILTLCILYFVNPFDIIPDILPVFGFADDALLFAALFKSMSVDLKKYSEWKGYSTEKYF